MTYRPHRTQFYLINMPDVGEAINATSLFAGVIGLLFANWTSEIDATLSRSKPAHYVDRKKYIQSLISAFFTRSLPLVTILLLFCYAQIGHIIEIARSSHLANTLSTKPPAINIEWTIFVLVYAMLFYFFLVSLVALIRLVLSWLDAKKDRPANQSRITFFG